MRQAWVWQTHRRPTSIPFPKDNPYTASKAALGKKLYFDTRLSKANLLSCAACHNPGYGWGDGQPTGVGHLMNRLGRRSPTIINAAYAQILMWDGRASSLEEQALGPIESAMVGGSSSWPGDPAILSELRLGFRFMETGALYVQSGLGYAPVNQRELVQIAFGGQLWLRVWKLKPFVRLAVIHQHEESTASWKNDFGESLLGIGNGIRHRAGAEAALGMDFPFYRSQKVEIDGSIEASSPWYPDDRGPHFYVFGGLGLGVHYAL